MLPIILGIATIIGGLAAVVFFLDRFRPSASSQLLTAGLSGIERDLRAVRAPLLPCRIFLTLRYEATAEDLEHLFKGEPGYRAFGPDRGMPPPPLGLPPGMSEGRVVWPNAYLNFENGALTGAGLFNLGHPRYNTVDLPASHTVASMSRESIDRHAAHHPLLAPPQVQVQLTLDPVDTSDSTSATLTLTSPLQKNRVVAAHALDNHVFVDHVLPLVPTSVDPSADWSQSDLARSLVEVAMGFLYINPFFWLEEKSWPQMHNLQFWMGPEADRALTFSTADLETQVVGDDPSVPVSGQGRSIQLRFNARAGDSPDRFVALA